jgi:hypothetical protein
MGKNAKQHSMDPELVRAFAARSGGTEQAIQMIMESLENKGLIRDSGKRRNGKIVFEAAPALSDAEVHSRITEP